MSHMSSDRLVVKILMKRVRTCVWKFTASVSSWAGLRYFETLESPVYKQVSSTKKLMADVGRWTCSRHGPIKRV